jgi:hypothetical protein
MLAEAQRVAATASIERGVGFLGNLSAVDPEIMDIVDLDKTGQGYLDSLSFNPAYLNDNKTIAAIRQQRAAQQKQAQALEATPAAVDAAKTLSETQVGGGQSALASMLNG